MSRARPRSCSSARRHVVQHLRRDVGAVSTTMLDDYGLPDDWPARTRGGPSARDTARDIENALLAEVRQSMGPRFRDGRFLPNLLVHEFEALLFSDCFRFARAIDRADLREKMEAIRNAAGGPEEIDDSPETCPSARVNNLVPEYEKPLHGNLAALEIGISRIRRECPHFGEWLDRLEALPARFARDPSPT